MTGVDRSKPGQEPNVHSRLETVYKAEKPSIRLERPDINSREGFIIVPEFPPGHPKYLIPRTPMGSPGSYKITFKLAIPGNSTFQKDMDFSKMTGESLLVVPRDMDELRVDTNTDGQSTDLTFSWNGDGTLATAAITVNAANISEAERQGYNLISSLLSQWCFKYDVAVDISAYTVLEESTDVVKLAVGLVGKLKPLDFPDSFQASAVFRPLFSTYREAINATNVFYQALCFYKVIEGIRKMRGKRPRSIKSIGFDESIPLDINVLPFRDQVVLETFHKFLGWKFSRVVDHYRDTLRNAVAHLDSDKLVLNADSFEDFVKYWKAVMVLKYIAREMLQNELASNLKARESKVA